MTNANEVSFVKFVSDILPGVTVRGRNKIMRGTCGSDSQTTAALVFTEVFRIEDSTSYSVNCFADFIEQRVISSKVAN